MCLLFFQLFNATQSNYYRFEVFLGGRHVEHVCMDVSVEALHGIGDATGWDWLPNNDNFQRGGDGEHVNF